MKTLALKPQHQDSVIGQILGLKAQLEYHKHNIAPFTYEMEKWEAKEYQAVHEDNLSQFNDLRNHIISNEAVFNLLLCDYNLSVAIFINLFVNN